MHTVTVMRHNANIMKIQSILKNCQLQAVVAFIRCDFSREGEGRNVHEERNKGMEAAASEASKGAPGRVPANPGCTQSR